MLGEEFDVLLTFHGLLYAFRPAPLLFSLLLGVPTVSLLVVPAFSLLLDDLTCLFQVVYPAGGFDSIGDPFYDIGVAPFSYI